VNIGVDEVAGPDFRAEHLDFATHRSGQQCAWLTARRRARALKPAFFISARSAHGAVGDRADAAERARLVGADLAHIAPKQCGWSALSITTIFGPGRDARYSR